MEYKYFSFVIVAGVLLNLIGWYLFVLLAFGVAAFVLGWVRTFFFCHIMNLLFNLNSRFVCIVYLQHSDVDVYLANPRSSQNDPIVEPLNLGILFDQSLRSGLIMLFSGLIFVPLVCMLHVMFVCRTSVVRISVSQIVLKDLDSKPQTTINSLF